MVGKLAGHAAGVEETETEVAINGQGVFGTEVDGGCQGVRLRLLSVFVNREDFFKVVGQGVELIVELVVTRVFATGVDGVLETVEGLVTG